MRKLMISFALLLSCATAQNLTPAQKEADFRYLVSLYQTYYAPLAWKKQLFGFDALNMQPWLERVAATKTDLDFYEVCAEFVSGLNDSHVFFALPSDFAAQLGFGVDIYDGVALIDTINRALLPAARYPFGIGDQLVSIDGEEAIVLASRLAKYFPQGNPRAALRLGAARLTSRFQSRLPHAPDLGETATVIIKRQSGAEEMYTIPWTKTGTPVVVGPVPSPKLASAQVRTVIESVDPLEELQTSAAPLSDQDAVNGYGARNPIFLAGLPSGFTRRLGGVATDFFYSGVFQFGNYRIGYIRIPNYAPPSQPTALRQFETEVTFMNENTDGLIVDEMRNTGGSLCFGEQIAQRLTPYEFRVTSFELRAFWLRVLGFYNAMINAVATNQPPEVVAQYELLFKEMLAANREGKIVTKPLPICTSSLTRQPVLRADGTSLAYEKPIIVLIDDFSTSTADSVAAMLQDSGRALLYGTRTNGAGGNNISMDAGVFSEAFVGMTIALQSRKGYVVAEGFPTSMYIENVGVRPDVDNDYMTKENLLRNGAPFISQFLGAMEQYIQQQRK
jgi:peptidase S41-like protein